MNWELVNCVQDKEPMSFVTSSAGAQGYHLRRHIEWLLTAYPAHTLAAQRAGGGAQTKVLLIDRAVSLGFDHGYLYTSGIKNSALHPAWGGYNVGQPCHRADETSPGGSDVAAGGPGLLVTTYIDVNMARTAQERILDAVQGCGYLVDAFIAVCFFCRFGTNGRCFSGRHNSRRCRTCSSVS